MQKKVYRFVSYLLILLLLPLFTIFLFACSKKSDTPSVDNSSPETPAPVVPTPDTPTTEIPNSPVFTEIVEYAKTQSTPNNGSYSAILINSKNDSSIYPDLTENCYFSYSISTDTLYYINLYYPNPNSEIKDILGFILQIPNLADYTKHNFEFTYLKYKLQNNSIASANLTIPATAYNNTPTTLTLPELQHFSTSGNDANADLSAFRSICVQDINNAFANFNTFFIEKIKNGDTKYNNAVFKFFSLPVMLTA